MKLLIATVTFLSNFSAGPAIWSGRNFRGLLWYYAWFSFLADVTSLVLYQVGISSSITGNLFYVAEIVLIGMYFSQKLFSGRLQSFFQVLSFGIAGWFVVDSIDTWQHRVEWKDIALALALFVFFCLLGLYKVISNIEHFKIERSPLFTFSAAFLLYASYTLVLMLFADHFRQAPKELRQQLWSIHNILNVVKNLAIARMFYMQQQSELNLQPKLAVR
jgi:hypothetical protein